MVTEVNGMRFSDFQIDQIRRFACVIDEMRMVADMVSDAEKRIPGLTYTSRGKSWRESFANIRSAMEKYNDTSRVSDSALNLSIWTFTELSGYSRESRIIVMSQTIIILVGTGVAWYAFNSGIGLLTLGSLTIVTLLAGGVYGQLRIRKIRLRSGLSQEMLLYAFNHVITEPRWQAEINR